MARPKSDTVDYFTHDSNASIRKTLTVIEARFGIAGYAFWYKLLEWLAGSAEGHFYDAREDADLEFLAEKCRTDASAGTQILQKLADLGAIDAVLWEHRIIWSQNFTDRLADVYKKRGRELPAKPCFCDGKCRHKGIKGLNDRVPTAETPQRKPDKKKTNQTSGNNRRVKKSTSVVMSPLSQDEGLVCESFAKHIGEITPEVRGDVSAALLKFPASWVADACKEAGNKPHDRSWPYVLGILRNWAREGRSVENGTASEDADKYHSGKFSHLVQG